MLGILYNVVLGDLVKAEETIYSLVHILSKNFRNTNLQDNRKYDEELPGVGPLFSMVDLFPMS